MGSPLVPAFVVERHAGLLDFWTVYQQLTERNPETAFESGFREVDLPPQARAHVPDEMAVQARRCRELLGEAMTGGDWQPYLDEVRSLGGRCAALGIKFASWFAVAQALRKQLIPALVDAYVAAPARLAEAMQAAFACVDFWLAAISEPYVETSHLNQFRLLADADRRSLEDRFRALAGATPDAIVTADHVGRITYVNHATEALFGRSAVALLGQPLTVLMPARLRDGHTQGIARYLRTREARVIGKTLEMPALRSDGTEIAIELSIATWAARGEISFAAIIRDISERKQIAATLEQRTRLLESTNRELEAFSYSVAHDLQAPLRGVASHAQILLEDHAEHLPGEAAGHAVKIQHHAASMAALIEALLELARVSHRELELQPIDLSGLARSVTAEVAAAEPGRSVEIGIASELRATADPRLARTLLENLIGNAWKFTARSGSPQITVGSADGRTFFVRDNGAGFDLARAGRLFSPFERLHTTDEFPGTGIGLATAQRIVHRHGGRIWVDAQVNAGATFFFTLAPAEPERSASR
jgi:PAS domain S-box-containing protein